MASAINTVTKEYIPRGVPYDADMGDDWIINPTQKQLNEVLEPSLDDLKSIAMSKAKMDAQVLIEAGYEFDPYGVFKSSEDYQNRLCNLLTTLDSVTDDTIRFTLKNGEKVDVLKSDVPALCNGLSVFVRAEIKKLQDKEDAIKACTTKEELDALG